MANIRNLLKKVASPDPAAAGAVPIWVLNGTLQQNELQSQIEKMNEQGVREFIVRPETGVTPAYPSQDFNHRFASILRAAKLKKMSVLFSDDLLYGYPGTAQELAERHHQYRLRYLSLYNILKIKGPRKITLDFDLPDLKYFFGLKVKEKFLDFSSAKNLTPYYSNGQLKLVLPAGDWRIFAFRWCYNKRSIGGYVFNCFSPEAARAYIDRTMARMKRDLPRDAIPALKGFFIELPNVAPDTTIRGLPWSEEISSALKSACRTDFMNILLSLYIDNFSSKNGLIRRSYYKLLLNLLHANFMRPLEEYGSKNRFSMRFMLTAGDLFSGETVLKFNYETLLKKTDIAGIADHAPFALDNGSSFRLFGELKRWYGRKPCSVIIGRNKNAVSNSLKDLKFESDRLTLNGLHHFVVDGHPYQVRYQPGQRSPVNPFVQTGSYASAHRLLDLLKRKQTLFTDTVSLEEVGVLFPAESLTMAYNPGSLSAYKHRLGNVEALVNQLFRDDIHFRLLTEELLTRLTVSDKGAAVLRMGRSRAAFRVLIIPEAVILNRKVVSLLEKFVHGGGRLIFFGITPYETFESGKNAKLLAGIEKASSETGGTVHKLTKVEELENLRALCLKTVQPPVDIFIEAEGVRRVLSRTFTEGDTAVHFLLNTSPAENVKTQIRFSRKGFLHYLDLNTGHCHLMPSAGGAEGVKSLTCNFAPAEAACFILSPRKLAPAGSHVSPADESNRIFRIILKDEWQLTPLDLNALPLNAWSMRINTNREINSGFNLAYESYLNVQHIPSRSLLLMNQLINLPVNGRHSGHYPVEVSFNGVILKNMNFFGRGEKTFHETDTIKSLSYAGLSGLAADVTGHVRRGINRITIKTYGSVFAPLQLSSPLLFLGDFALKRGNQGWLVVQKNEMFTYGSWTEQGYPYFCGRAVYSQIFEKPGSFKKVLLKFKNFEASVAVRINGTEMPLPVWQPVTVDITKTIQSEKNRIEIEVSNTPTNLLKLMNAPSGLTAEVYLDVYQ